MTGKDLKVIVTGVGEMGKVGVQCLLEHNIKIVAAVDIKEELIGRDVAEVAGCPAIGVPIENDFAAAVARTKPNVCFSASDPGLEYNFEDWKVCAENKINVVTTIMAPYYPVSATQEKFDELDKLFKDNGVSLFASGINDVWWSGIGMDIIGTCKKVESIDFTNKLPLENMGAGVARDFRVNEDPQAFIDEMSTIDLTQEESVEGPLLAALVDAEILGLTVKDTEIEAAPVTAKEDIPMPQWDMVIKAGNMQGQSFNIRITTEEGIDITTSMVIKVMDPGEAPGTSWDIKGEPNLHVELGDICGEITTSATPVNRIPEVINAKPGILKLSDLPERPVYRHGEWGEF